jgi:cobalt-zinc-cadmium efflux system protein
MNNNLGIDKTNLKIKKIKIILVLLCSYLVVEVLAGYITGSLALLADASHMFADVFGVALVLFAYRLAESQQHQNIHTDFIELKSCLLL